MNDATTQGNATLMADLQEVISKGEDALQAAASMTSAEASSLRERVRTRVAGAREDLARIQGLTVEKAKAAGRATNEYVNENPWKAVGIGAVVGLLVGVLAARR